MTIVTLWELYHDDSPIPAPIIDDGILLDLNNGSIHEKFITSNEYRKTFFDNF